MNERDVWNLCLKIIKDNIPQASFTTWFKPIKPVNLNNKVLTIQVPSPFFYEYLEEHYLDIIKKTLRQVLGSKAKLEYNVVVNAANQQKNTVNYPAKNNSQLSNKGVELPYSVPNKHIKNPFVIPGIKKVTIESQLNPDFSFQNFVVGSCNKFAHTVGLAISKSPGNTGFNPLLLYGESGLGKTHLAQAIGVSVKDRFPDKVVLYVSAHKFQLQYTDAVRKNTLNDFLHFYQMIDVLIIDDIHDLMGKTKTQNTFFHIFNHLHQLKKQLILTSDRAPVDLEGIEKRLLSRFRWGLQAEMEVPDLETRKKILHKKTYVDGLSISQEVIDFIAEKVNSSVRELESVIFSLLAQSTMNKQEITIELAEKIVTRLVKYNKRKITVDQIKKTVAEYYNITVEELISKSRRRNIALPRQVAIYFTTLLTDLPLAAIGAEFGNRNHSTIVHNKQTVQNLLETDKKMKQDISEIERRLKLVYR